MVKKGVMKDCGPGILFICAIPLIARDLQGSGTSKRWRMVLDNGTLLIEAVDATGH